MFVIVWFYCFIEKIKLKIFTKKFHIHKNGPIAESWFTELPESGLLGYWAMCATARSGRANLHSDRLWCSGAQEVFWWWTTSNNLWNITIKLEIYDMKISSRAVSMEHQVCLLKILLSLRFHCSILPCVFVYVSFQDVDLLCFSWSILQSKVEIDITFIDIISLFVVVFAYFRRFWWN